jgi:hypothetical protein
MTVPTNTHDSYGVTGLKEDFSNIVTNISPDDTFFYKSLGTAPVTQKKHQFLTDALAAVGANKRIEGDTRTAIAVTAATAIYNMTQIMSKTFTISKSNLAMEAYGQKGGVNSEAYQTYKFLKELAQDREYAYLQETRADGVTLTTARSMRGSLNWTTTNLNKDAGATLNADGTVTGGTARALTRTILKDTMQDVFTSGGSPNKILCHAYQATQISELAHNGNYRQMVKDGELSDYVDVYVNEFGKFTIQIHRLMPTDVVFIYDPSMWKKCILRKVEKTVDDINQDGRKIDFTCEETLEARQEAASGRITNLIAA